MVPKVRILPFFLLTLLKVRYPLACSLHEVARIIGPDAAKKDLFPVINKLLHDKSLILMY